MLPGRKIKDRKRRDKKDQLSAPRVCRGRTDPYQAPYFFPSPVSLWACNYVWPIQLNRKLDSCCSKLASRLPVNTITPEKRISLVATMVIATGIHTVCLGPCLSRGTLFPRLSCACTASGVIRYHFVSIIVSINIHYLSLVLLANLVQ
jgi:hypothetical protein